jgi:exosome complex exonuclease RRP6
METTPFTFVNTEQQLAILIDDLNKVSEIAIDLEHHNHRSYLGITCLMQISTRHSDYVLDTLALRPQLHKLLPVFSNPAIIKVLHGADMDVLWL